MTRCPKCGTKLHIYNISQYCPQCKTNLMYADFKKSFTVGLLPDLIRSTLTPLNALMTVVVFKWSGYKAEISPAPWSQNSKVVYRRVLFLYCAFETFKKVISLIPYFLYDIIGEKREKMYIALNERRAMLANEKTVSDEMQAMIEMLEVEAVKE